jgi:phage terminase large subunit
MIEKNSNYFLDCGTPILVHNSSKSWSLAQLFFAIALENRHEQTVLSVVRKSLPSLRATAMKDFFDILKSHGLYDEKLHNMSERTYKIGRSMIEFFSVDDAQKMRSRKRDYLWINEANELSEEEFFQLNVRTSKQIFMDYNPSEIVHWIYSHPAISQNSAIINSTYKDNPFLSPQIVSELLSLKDTDEEYWNVYGLGLRARSKKIIYTNWDVCQRIPEGDVFYGLDFGHTAPTALLEVTRIDNELWERELVYEGMTNAELIVRLGELGVLLDAEIWADSEAPDRIAEIGNAGWRNVRPAEKGKGSVEYGIGVVKRHKVHVLESSVNLIKEKQAYKWKTDRAGEVIEGQPHKFLDHLMDAERYAVAGHCKVRESQGLEVLFEI